MPSQKPEISGTKASRADNRNILPIAGDIVILVMGMTGSGKSTFINTIPGRNSMVVGHEMESCTSGIVTSEVDIHKFPDFPYLENRRLILVDTPGFDNTYTNGPDILKHIGEWLADSYQHDIVLGGIIYLYDISSDRFTGTARNDLIVLKQICGEEALKNVVLGTTKACRLSAEEAKSREARFKDIYWGGKINKEVIFRIDEGNPMQAWILVNTVLERFQSWRTPVLRIQRELVDQKRSIDQTLAWTTAWNSLTAWTVNIGKVWRKSAFQPPVS